jgi:hypothetical protein
MACLHCSFFIQKITRQAMYGCDIDNIHIRHTNLFASLKETSHVHRTHDDWKGVTFNATAEDIFNAFPLPTEEDDTNDNGHNDEDRSDSGSHHHGTRLRGRKQQAASEELLKKKERIANIRSQMFEILNVLETIPPRDLEETHAPAVETGLIALREGLPVFPMQVLTTVAKRPAGQRPKGSGATRRRTATETGPAQPQPSRSVVVINSNSEHDEQEEEPPLRNFRWNALTREVEYRSADDARSSDDSDDVLFQ